MSRRTQTIAEVSAKDQACAENVPLGVHGLCLLSLSESAAKATRRVLAACVQYLYVYAVVP